jgi:hypothetical protein
MPHLRARKAAPMTVTSPNVIEIKLDQPPLSGPGGMLV